ncbi:hypothetical protein SEUCBS140593_007487 [Sporothrix eucalyptigena]|uniref:Uncharacterized protein n=1 Tax=Sporothrix eucalyptigena TaxID=1812306 RepID=A0ABP0CDP5_9PEZI
MFRPASSYNALQQTLYLCQWPVRSRRLSLVALFTIQVPAMVCLALKLFGRLKQKARLAVDDYLVMLSTPVFLVFLVVGQYAAAIGFGVDIWTLPSDKIVKCMKP